MPSSNKTRKSQRRTSSPRRIFANDPLYQAMEKGDVLWGDLMYNLDHAAKGSRKSSKSSRGSSKPRRISPNPEKEMLEGYKTPELRLRKDIYENFPVIVNEIGPNLYEIVWNEKNIEEWRKTKALSWEEYQEYELYSEYRLFHALRKHADRYELLPTRRAAQIAIFRMKMEEPSFRGPKLMRLNDIKNHFPVVWNKVDGRAGETTYAIVLRGDYQRKTAKANVKATEKALVDALRASPAWKVLAAVGDETCRIEMKHE